MVTLNNYLKELEEESYNISCVKNISIAKLEENIETIAHMDRCSQIAYSFGLFLNLYGNRKIDFILLEKAAKFHDVGKFNIAKNILYKDGKLTEEEYGIIKHHVKTNIIFKNDVINKVILYHHERIDKNGYYKINSNNLDDIVRIISIIDAYDVMANRRCYKNKIFSTEHIISELIKVSGTQLDVEYVNLFIKFITKDMKRIA